MKKFKSSDFLEQLIEMLNSDPDMKRSLEEDERYKKERKQYHLSNGCSEQESIQKSWDDYWKMAKERDGVEFSVERIEYEGGEK